MDLMTRTQIVLILRILASFVALITHIVVSILVYKIMIVKIIENQNHNFFAYPHK